MPCSLSLRFIAVFLTCITFSIHARAQDSDPADKVCPRFSATASASNPPELRSRQGVLETTLLFKTAVDDKGLTRYCYIGDSGIQAPTLRVNPGDKLIIHLQNVLKPVTGSPDSSSMHMHGQGSDAACGGGKLSASSTNLHFHGLYVPPTCHQDEVIHTAIESGSTFDYEMRIPANQPPGLYWYHPHPHGFTQRQIQGGASGAIVVEGIQAVYPQLGGLPERILVLRDQPLAIGNDNQSSAPSWDVSVNYVPVTYPQYKPATIFVKPAERQFWRVVNAAANTIFDLQLIVNGAPQELQVFAIDGVPIQGGPLVRKDIFLGPGARAEFVFTAPGTREIAQLITKHWNTGPAGDSDPRRPLVDVVSASTVRESTLAAMPKQVSRPSDLATARPTIERKFYFAEWVAEEDEGDASASAGKNDDASTRFYLFEAGKGATQFDMNRPPNLVVHQGTVEDWVLTNTTFEDHVFHIHQLHFQVMEINGQPVHDLAIRDTINIPHRGTDGATPSVKLRMDFRGANLVGTFLYQCHIVAHEEGGMMGSIQVLPPGRATSIEISTSAMTIPLRQPITITATVMPAIKGGAAPTGTVEFTINGNVEGPPTPVLGGQATRVFSFYRAAVNVISATYSGDAKHEASQTGQIRIIANTNESSSP